MMDYRLGKTLEQTRQLNLTGNIIPHSWYSKITFESGTPDLLGTVLLAEIVYWYRPIEVKDEHTGRLLGYKKKFAADMLQRSLQSFADQFGSTKRQMADALKRLEDAGLIIKKVRTVETSQGRLNNVLYVAPVPEKIALLDNNQADFKAENFDIEKNSEIPAVSPATFERSRGYDRTYQVVHSNVPPHTPERSTYTENTTKITTENTAAAQKAVAAAVFSKKLNPKPLDSIIGEKLTDYQIQAIQITASFKSDLVKEIENAILSKNSFSNAQGDFHKKLNTIKKLIKENRWTTPICVIQEKQISEKKVIDPLNQELRESELDYAHWQKMVNLMLETGKEKEAEKYRHFLFQAKEKLDQVKLKFSNVLSHTK